MRMWQVNPKIMCRQHLLGEHRELHALEGCLRQNIKLDGYLRYGVLELRELWTRHEDLVDEMVRRGYNHKSPMAGPDAIGVIPGELPGDVDRDKSLGVLLDRCERCRQRYEELGP